jgi:hypothetical protein
MRKRLALSRLAVLFAVIVGAVSALAFTGASAKISPPSCETSSGQTPPGQQPVCQGGGLEQQPAKNPADHAPPGQQP